MRTSLQHWGFEQESPVLHDALLVANELLANGVRACVRTVDVEVGGHRDQVEIVVSDDGPGTAKLVDRGPTAETGRGMRIVDAICDEWGQTPTGSEGKRVWGRLALESAPAGPLEGCHR